MSTVRTGLAGMPGVYFDHGDTAPCRLVLDKAIQLSKAPCVKASFQIKRLLLATPDLGELANVFQVLKDKRGSWWGVLHNAFGEDVIVVFALPKPFPRQTFEVTLCRFVYMPPTVS